MYFLCQSKLDSPEFELAVRSMQDQFGQKKKPKKVKNGEDELAQKTLEDSVSMLNLKPLGQISETILV